MDLLDTLNMVVRCVEKFLGGFETKVLAKTSQNEKNGTVFGGGKLKNNGFISKTRGLQGPSANS